MVEEAFKLLLLRNSDIQSTTRFWDELSQAYSEPHRHYHTLAHLQHVLSHMLEARDQFEDWDAALFALFYHDVVYNILSKDNEEQSADFAVSRLHHLQVSTEKIERCRADILASKTHAEHHNNDVNLFTDADLSILGEDWETYRKYCQQVRNEYAVYPDLLYKPGRKKVLEHFLKMKTIFKTAFFFSRLEGRARQNITREITEFL